jgi:predicted TIM-barrel fold metal-dependent hydrolase
MGDAKWRRGFAMLANLELMFDLQTPWWHLAEAADLAADFPETTIVLNHTGLPSDRSAEGLAGWRRGMAAFAARPNATVKISGIGLKGRSWSAEENRAVVLDTIAIFGFERCMFASNFPVDGVTGSFDTIIGGYRAITAHLPEAQQRALFHDNAVRIYRLGDQV